MTPISPDVTALIRSLEAVIDRLRLGKQIEMCDVSDIVDPFVGIIEERSQRTRVNVWHTGKDYNAGFESSILRTKGMDFMRRALGESTRLMAARPKLADFGCWAGRHFPLLLSLSNDVTVFGIDESFATQRLDQAKVLFERDKVTFINSGFENLNLPPYSLDGGICWRVLHNLTSRGELTRALKAISAVLKPEAPLIVAVRAAFSWMAQECDQPQLLRTYQQDGERDDLYFTERAIERMFSMHSLILQPEGTHKFEESEEIDGQRITNAYYMVFLKKGD